MHHQLSQLSYVLIQGEPSLEPLRILETRAIRWRGCEVTFHVLGASHAVRFKRDGECVTELLSCKLPPLSHGPNRAATLIQRPAIDAGNVQLTVMGLSIDVCLSPFLLTDGDELDGVYSAKSRLDVEFPRVANATPITRIGWAASDDLLRVETVHSYPEEGRAVRSVGQYAILRSSHVR